MVETKSWKRREGGQESRIVDDADDADEGDEGDGRYLRR